MTNEHMPDRIVEHRVVRREDGATWVSEDRVHAFMDEAFPDDLRACSFRRHMRTSVHCWSDISQIDSRSDKISIADALPTCALVVCGRSESLPPEDTSTDRYE